MSNYVVRPGETISDVIMNATGSLSNWDAILTANGFTDWVPDLVIDQQVVIPDSVVVDNNTLRQMTTYPACNRSVNNVLDLINDVVQTILNNWILATGFWNDKAVWIDTSLWID